MNAKIPGLLMTSEPGSFARSTIVERKPQIIARVISDNEYPRSTVDALDAFRREIAEGMVRPLVEQAPDVQFWNREARAYSDRTWLELPWYLAETYFYRRLLEAVGHFQPGVWHRHDPFAVQKRAQERAAARELADVQDYVDNAPAGELLEILLHSCLWGNRADLSNLTVGEEVRGGAGVVGERHNVLIDDTRQVVALLGSGLGRVSFVNDNTGWELLFDLSLADHLLSQRLAKSVVFHLKGQPFFVSDAMITDVHQTLDLLGGVPLGKRLQAHLDSGRLLLEADPFWTLCLTFRQMPAALARHLARSDLVIFKGDVNYRRLLDDAHWPHTARLEEVAAGFPAPLLVLRTLKGEILVGLEPGQAEFLAAQDPTWLINGQRGLIHYSDTLTL